MGREARFRDYHLGENDKVFYRYSYWGNITPDCDNPTGRYIFEQAELRNPHQALICRLKGIENPAIARFEMSKPHTVKEWLDFWVEHYAYDLEATEENSNVKKFFANYWKII